MPLISVIIAAYNGEKTIVETINSVLNQTHQDLEIIAIDDGSSDNTRQLIQDIADDRVKLFPYQNGGVAKARNRGLSHVRGDYVCFLDHDDLWTEDKLAKQVAALERSLDAGAVYSQTTNMYSEDEPTRYVPSPEVHFEGDVYQDILLSNFVGSGSNIMVRREAVESVGEFDPVPTSNEDWDYYIRLAAKWHFVVVPEYQIIYRHTANSMSSQVQRLADGGVILANKVFKSAPENLQHLKNNFLFNHLAYCAELYLENYNNSHGQDRKSLIKAYRTMADALRYSPSAIAKTSTLKVILKLMSVTVLPSALVKKLKKMKHQIF